MPNQRSLPLADLADLAGCCAPAGEPIEPAEANDLAAAFKALGDPVRLRLLALIAAKPDQTCVCDLLECFELTQPTISHHLKTLRQAGLVDCERRGTWVYYWVIPEAFARVRKLLDLVDAPAPVA